MKDIKGFLDNINFQLSDENIKNIGLIEVYKNIFNEDVSYDNAQRFAELQRREK